MGAIGDGGNKRSFLIEGFVLPRIKPHRKRKDHIKRPPPADPAGKRVVMEGLDHHESFQSDQLVCAFRPELDDNASAYRHFLDMIRASA